MKMVMKPIVISVLLGCIVSQTTQADDAATAVKSLDLIMSQSSEIPSLLVEKPISLPEAEIAPATKPAPMKKSAAYRLQTSQAQTEAVNAQLSVMKAEQEKKIAELIKQYASSQDTSAKALAEQQSKLAESEKQLADLQTKWQNTAQKLESANKQIAEVTAVRLNEGQELAELKQLLADSQNQAETLTKEVAALTAGQTEKVNEIAALKKTVDESSKERTELETKWQKTNSTLEEQIKQMAAIQSSPETPVPVSKEDIRAYALGAFWGNDVLDAMKKVEEDGFKVSQAQVVSGVTDMMSGKFKVPKEKILAELQDMDANATAKATSSDPVAEDSKAYITQYSKKPGVKKAEMGYYYRITEKGRGAIKNTDTVAIAVTESLTNGRVIKDMNKAGKLLILPLDKLPPLFKTAISHMNNHGKLQMVVPPALAYGEAGRAPNIPPNATMVYDINIVDVNPTK